VSAPRVARGRPSVTGAVTAEHAPGGVLTRRPRGRRCGVSWRTSTDRYYRGALAGVGPRALVKT